MFTSERPHYSLALFFFLLKEKRLVPVSSKSKRLLFPPDINLVTRHYRPEARGNVMYPVREQPAVDTSLYHRLKADKRRTFTLARISQGFQKYTEEITFTYCPSSFTSQISTVTYIVAVNNALSDLNHVSFFYM